MTGRFLSTYAVVLSLPLAIDHLPDRGESVRATAATTRPGGGFTLLATAASLGAHACMLAPLGTGKNSVTVRQQLADCGVELLSEELVGDIGAEISFIEADGSTTSVVAPGVEAEPSRPILEAVELKPGDMVHIAGSDLSSTAGAHALSEWGGALPEDVTLVVSISPAVDQVPLWAWQRLLGRADIVSMNIREAVALSRSVGISDPISGVRSLLKPDAAIVRRLSMMGCEVYERADGPRQEVPAFAVDPVDTTGVGDTHVGAMCAFLINGYSLAQAAQAANAASAITLSHEAPMPAPTLTQVRQVMEQGRVASRF